MSLTTSEIICHHWFMKILIHKLISTTLIYSLFSLSLHAAEDVNLRDIVLPSQVKDIKKASGSVYYGTSPKSGALMPVHIWGEVKKSGLYYIPVNSTLIQGLSLAGGTTPNSNLSEIKVKREKDGAIEEQELDLSEGGNNGSYHYQLKAGDTIFIGKDTHMQDRAFYTSLISVFFTLLSSIVLLKEIKDN